MTDTLKNSLLFALVFTLIILSGLFQGWNNAMFILNMGIISAIMALGVNLQWGFAGLFNVGVMGFVALGGLAAVLIGMPATPGAFSAGGPGVILALVLGPPRLLGLFIFTNECLRAATEALRSRRYSSLGSLYFVDFLIRMSS